MAKEDKLQPVTLLREGTNAHTNPKLCFKITQKHSHVHPTYGQPTHNTTYPQQTQFLPDVGWNKQPKPNRMFYQQPGK